MDIVGSEEASAEFGASALPIFIMPCVLHSKKIPHALLTVCTSSSGYLTEMMATEIQSPSRQAVLSVL